MEPKKLKTYGIPEYRTFHKVPHKNEQVELDFKLAYLKAIDAEYNLQKSEHPWLSDSQLKRVAKDHVDLKLKGGKSHG
jgi:hypothetical protein